MSGPIFTIEGVIAAGKTELAMAIADALRKKGLTVCLVLEPVETWREIGILQKFYNNPERFGYAFQTFVFATRIASIAEALAKEPNADLYILERTPATDNIFMELQRDRVDPTENAMYAKWCDVWRRLLPVGMDDITVIYLRPSLDVCMRRLLNRNRSEEVTVGEKESVTGVTFEYQKKLSLAHEAFFLGKHPGLFPNMPKSSFKKVAVIESKMADCNFKDAGPERDEVINEVLRMMGSYS
jgi:deoxyadenosine/deoxycytidine kinase